MTDRAPDKETPDPPVPPDKGQKLPVEEPPDQPGSPPSDPSTPPKGDPIPNEPTRLV